MALGTDYIIRYLSDISGAVKGAKDLETVNANVAKNIQAQYGQVTRIVGNLAPKIQEIPIKVNGQDAIKTISTVGEVVQTTNGSFLEMSKTQTFVQGQLIKTSGGVKDVTSQFVKTNLEAEKGNKVFSNFADNVKQLAGRALLTIPIWIALRGVIMGVFQGISSGFSSFIELDKALNKARVAAGGTIEEMKKEMATLKPFMEKLVIETGQSIKDLGDVFFSFRASGLDFKTSLAGMEVSNKIARTQMGDVKKVAESLAKVMLLMGDSFESGGTSIDKMNAFAALSYELNTRNAFSIDQLTDSMLAFAPSAKTAGLSAEQAVKLMATINSAGIMSSAAGRTMATGLSKFILNFKELVPLLGIKIDPKTGTFNALMQTLEALKLLNAQGTLNPEFTKAIDDLFGGEKGGKTVKGLIAVFDLLKQNVAMTGDINKMNNAYNEVNDSVSIQIDKFHQLRDAAFRTFVTGVIGGEDFKTSVKNFNQALESSLNLINLIGEAIPNARFTVPGAVIGTLTDVEKTKKSFADLVSSFNVEIQKGLKGQLSIPELKITLDKLETKTAKSIFAPGTISQLKESLQKQLSEKEIELKNVTVSPDSKSKFIQAGSDEEKIAKQKIDFKLNELKLNEATNVQLLIAKQLYTEQAGIIEDEVEKSKNKLDLISAIQAETKHLSDIQKEGVINNQIEFLKLLGATNVGVIEQRIEYEKALNIHQTTEDLLDNKLKLSRAITEEEIKLDNIQKIALIENQLEILRLQGATSLQIVKQRIELEKMYNINQTKENALRSELELNQEITKEKINQNKITSDSLKIFQISQKFGIQKAEQAAQFLKGNISLNELQPFGRNNTLMPIIKEFFSSQLEQMQASEFFFKGEGRNLNIPERKTIEEFRPIKLESFKLPDISTQIGQINVEVKKVFKEQDGASALLDSMLDAIRNDQKLRGAINEMIDEY